MKRLSKIFLLFITIFSILVLAGGNDVFAFANQYIAWRKDVNNDGKPDLLFRRYTTATQEQLAEYYKAKGTSYLTTDDGSAYLAYTYNGVTLPSKWVHPETAGIAKPSEKEFVTIGYSFHTEQAGTYGVGIEGGTTAAMISYDEDGLVTPITNSIENVLKYFNKVDSNILKPVILDDVSYEEIYDENETLAYNNIMPSLIYEIYSNKGAIKQVNFGTRWNISTLQPNNKLVYRYAIMEIARTVEGVVDREYVYIEDRVIYHDDLLELRAAMDEAGIESTMYMSDIVISAALYDAGGYELSRTASQFFSQYKKHGYTTEFWPDNVIGTAEEATQSAVNLFDNAITLPKKSKRNVIVRHISIGNNTKITDSALSSATFLFPNNMSMQIKDEVNGEYVDIDATHYINAGSAYWELYAENIEIYQYMKKAANSYTDGHVAIGYNVATGSSLEDAAESLNIKLNWGSYKKMVGSNAIEVDGLIAESESEWVVIDFYYTKKPDVVYVNHLLVDVNNKVLDIDQQIIEGNYYAYTGTYYTEPIAAASPRYNSLEPNETVINRIQEQYYRQEGQSIMVRTSLSLLDERFSLLEIFSGIRYVGYEVYDTYVPYSKLVGKTVNPRKDWYKPFDVILGVVIPPNKTQVNFYYYNQDRQEAAIPDKFISMEYYFKAENANEEGNCNNENMKAIVSVPSGTNVKTGLVNLYKVMASSINLKYIPENQNKHDVDAKLKYICGSDSITLTANNVKYSFSYFRVEEMVVDALTDIILYDASSKWSSTSGGSIFSGDGDWRNYQLTKKWTTETKVKLSALDKEIPNDYDEISDWRNYAEAQIVDKDGKKSNWDPEDIYLESTILTKSQMDTVDANGDGKVNEKDLAYARKELQDRYNTLTTIKGIHDWTIQEYNEKYKQYLEACENYDAAVAETKLIQQLVYDAEQKLANAEAAVQNAKDDVTDLREDISGYNDDIKEYNGYISDYKDEIYKLENVTIPTLKSEKSNLETQKSNLESELEDMKEDLEGLEDEKEALDATLDTLEDDLKNLETTVASDLATATQSAKDAMDRKQDDVDANCTPDENGNYTQACTDAQNALEAAKDKYDAAVKAEEANDQAIEAKKKEIDAQEALIDAKQDEIDDQEEEIDDQESAISTKETQITNKQTEIDNAYGSITRYENLITYYNNLIKTRNSQINQAYIDIRNIENITIPALMRDVANAQTAVQNERGKLNLIDEAKALWYLAVKGACWLEVEVRQIAYDAATKAVNAAQSSYDKYYSYVQTLEKNYPKYQPLYEKFATIKSKAGLFNWGIKDALNYMNVKITFKVSNMLVNLNNANLNDPSKLTATKTLSLSTAMGQTTTLKAPTPVFYKSAYNGIGEKIDETIYPWSSIGQTVTNGLRTIAGEVKYETRVLIKKDTLFYDSTTSSVVDNVYYSNYVDQKESLTNGEFKLDYDGLVGKTSREVNIYTPSFVSAKLKSTTSEIVDQSTDKISSNSDVQTIQLGVPFTVTFGNKLDSADKVYKVTDGSKYKKGYYIKFDFDICNVKIKRNGSTVGWVNSSGTVKTGTAKNQVIKAGTWIGIIDSGTNSTQLTAEVYSDVTDENINIAEEERRSYTVRAVAYNSNYTLRTYYANKYDTLLDMMQYRSVIKTTVANICTDTDTTGDEYDMPSYFAERTYDLVVLNRLYDFRITDIKDVAWKSVFRENRNSVINAHTGNLYYSGIKKWVISGNDLTKTVARSASEIGRNPTRILPLGSYKHTDQTYVKAPKLGYTFSYDMKVTGAYYDSEGEPLDKFVEITTKFYYVSNDGKTFLEEYSSGKKGIYLFYKNAAGKYVRIDADGGGYKLSFTPNDSYRYIETSEKITLSNDKLELGSLRNIRLTSDMATVYQSYDTANTANNGTIITYYGEYKLPNSTIAVEVDANGKYDINKPLKNGYIGVIFDITAKAGTYNNGTPISLSYGKNTKTSQNTSQWDYEGYLGFDKPGYAASFTAATSIRLEDGNWNLTNDLYNKIKGTVILYDIDEKAATDYE